MLQSCMLRSPNGNGGWRGQDLVRVLGHYLALSRILRFSHRFPHLFSSGTKETIPKQHPSTKKTMGNNNKNNGKHLHLDVLCATCPARRDACVGSALTTHLYIQSFRLTDFRTRSSLHPTTSSPDHSCYHQFPPKRESSSAVRLSCLSTASSSAIKPPFSKLEQGRPCNQEHLDLPRSEFER